MLGPKIPGEKPVLYPSPSHSSALVQALLVPLPQEPQLTYALDTVHKHIYFLSGSQQCNEDVIVNRSEVSIWKKVCLIPQGHPCHVFTVHCKEKPQASASCCLKAGHSPVRDWRQQKVSLAEQNQLSPCEHTGLREKPKSCFPTPKKSTYF